MLTNWLAAEALIIERLKAQVPSARQVYAAADLGEIMTMTEVTPAVHVYYDGDDVIEQSARNQTVFQRWGIFVVARNAAAQTTGQDARSDAGAVIAEIIPAIQHWKPSQHHGRMIRISGPGAVYEGPLCLIPLLFRTELVGIGTAPTP